MDEQDPSVPSHARAGASGSNRRPRPRRRPRSDVSSLVHVNVPLLTNFTVIDNHLAQHPELSLVAMGLAAHIQSLPTGAPVDVETLARRFSSDNPDEIAAALRELETHGFLRGPGEAHPT